MVESQPSKLLVASSILVSRSIFFDQLILTVYEDHACLVSDGERIRNLVERRPNS
jgi:hypothetical protein